MSGVLKGFRRRFRPFIRRLLTYILPKAMRFKVYRKMISLRMPEGIVFKIAETKEQLTQAFKLLHNEYVRAGYMDPHPSGMRLTKYHALPSTTTLIAEREGRVVGTVSLIRQNTFGLPCEQVFDLAPFRKKGARVTEVSALAIDREFGNHQQGLLLWPMVKFIVEYATRFFGTDYLVMIVHPRMFDFYEAMLAFRPFLKKKFKYAFVKGNPGMGGYVSLRQFPTWLELNFGNEPTERNLAHFIELSAEAFYFPDRPWATVNDPVMTPELLDHFFRQESGVFGELSDEEKAALHAIYDSPAHKMVLPPPPAGRSLPPAQVRSAERHDVQCHARLIVPGHSVADARVTNASRTGLGAVIHRTLHVGQQYHLQVECGRVNLADLDVKLVWTKDDGSCGFQVTSATGSWSSFIESMGSGVHKVA